MASEVFLNIPIKNEYKLTASETQAQKLSCPICFEEYPPSTIITLPSCEHSFCSHCLISYLMAKIQNLQVLKLPCPQSGCPNTFIDKTIKEILNPDQYNRYQDLTLKKLANRDLNNKFCPKAGCSKPLRIFAGTESTACSCGTVVCNVCNNFWHEGKSCIEAMDLEFEHYSKQNDIRFCVLCKTVIKREQGCTHITCPVCDYEWCWICGREFAITHPCPGYWSPAPPSTIPTDNSNPHTQKIKALWRQSSTQKKICLVIIGTLGFPVILFGALMVWPLFVFFEENELSIKQPCRAIQVILTSLAIAIFCLPVAVLYVVVFLMFSIFAGPIYLVKRVARLLSKSGSKEKNEQNKTKRWMSGDVNKFVYTDKSKLENQDRPIVLDIEEHEVPRLQANDSNDPNTRQSDHNQKEITMKDKESMNPNFIHRKVVSEIREEETDESSKEVVVQDFKLKISRKRHSLGIMREDKKMDDQMYYV